MQETWRQFDPTAPWSMTNRAWKIDCGLFKTDESRSIGGRANQLLSRFTWELPQTIVGNLAAHGFNLLEMVDRVEYFGGVTYTIDEKSIFPTAFTLGSYVHSGLYGSIATKDFNSYVLSSPHYMHEYGHALQSQLYGPFYSLIAIGSGLNYLHDKIYNQKSHKYILLEKGANTRASIYFARYGVNWMKDKSGRETFDMSHPIYYAPNTKLGRFLHRSWYSFPLLPDWLPFYIPLIK